MKNLFDPMVIRGMDRIAQLIIEEEMKPGSPIPSPGELSQLLLMPEDIISRALLQLFYEGTLNGDPGTQQYCVAPPKLVLNAWPTIDHFIGKESISPTVAFFAVVEASKAVSNALRLPLGINVYCLRRLYQIPQGPRILVTSYLPESRFPHLMVHDFSSYSLYDALEKEYGIQADNQFLDFLVDSPTEEDCQLMGISPKEPLMILSRQTFSQFGDVFEYSIYKNPGRNTCYKSTPTLRGSM